jgi:hypothetical protein
LIPYPTQSMSFTNKGSSVNGECHFLFSLAHLFDDHFKNFSWLKSHLLLCNKFLFRELTYGGGPQPSTSLYTISLTCNIFSWLIHKESLMNLCI